MFEHQAAPTRRTMLAGLPLALLLPNLGEGIHATTDGEPPHPMLALLFVRDVTEQERAAGSEPRCFWSVRPTGRYGSDCETGAAYAVLALNYMAAAAFAVVRV